MRGKRLSRLLRIIALLRGVNSWNARRLAEYFGTGRRNIYRDMALLELAGVPFYFDAHFGEGGGYRIRDDWFFPSVQLSQQELLDLAVLARISDRGAICGLDGVGELRDKLAVALSPAERSAIRQTAEAVEVAGCIPSPEAKRVRQVMVVFQQSLIERRQVDGEYVEPGADGARTLQLQPRKLFLANRSWYVACDHNGGDSTQVYRLAQFRRVTLSNRPMTVPRDFCLQTFLGNSWEVQRGSTTWEVAVQFDRRVAPVIQQTQWHKTQKLVSRPDGSVVLRAKVSGLEEIATWILGWGADAKVLGPPELAAQVRRIATQITVKYV